MPELPEIDTMGYMPDPLDFIQIVPIQRGNGLWFQIVDQESGQTFMIDYITALKMAGRLTYLAGRVFQDVGQAGVDQMGPHEREGITRAMGDPTDERWQREQYRRPKN